MNRRRLSWALVVLVVVLAGAVRWRLLDVPLERDEGEYAYAGTLILDGIAPYAGLYNMKLPGTYAAYAAILAVFGRSARGIHLGLLLVSSVSVVLVFLLARRLFGELAGVTAAFVFAVLALGQPVQGMFANAEHFVLPFALGGLLLMLGAAEPFRWRPLLGGALLLGCAILMKQHAAAFVLAAVGYLALVPRMGPRRIGPFLAAVAAPYLVTCLVLWGAGVFERFWFWTVRYALLYAQQLPLSNAPSQLAANAGPVVGAAPGLWLLAAAGLISLPWAGDRRDARVFTALIALGSFLATCPGLVFRPHYFQLTLPAAGLAAGALASLLAGRLSPRRPMLGVAISATLVLLLGAQSLVAQRRPLFEMTPVELSRYTYSPNPFPESPEIAEIVRSHTEPGDRVAIMGSEPQVLFLAGRRSATGYVYTYALMEEGDHALRMQEEMIREIVESAPEVIVFVHVSHSWLRKERSNPRIFEWLREYLRDFRTVAAVEIGAERSRVFTGDGLERFDASAGDHVTIWKRAPGREAER